MFRNLSKTSMIYQVELCYNLTNKECHLLGRYTINAALAHPLRKAYHSDTANFAPQKKDEASVIPIPRHIQLPLYSEPQ